MPKKNSNQLSISDYELKEVNVRLCLKEGNAYYSKESMDNPRAAILIMKDILKYMDRETAMVVNLDNKLRPLNFNMVSVGDINQTIVPIQNIFKSSILSNASSILLLHNHPSGDPTPSNEDFQMTKRVAEAGKLLGITLMDHVIVGAMEGRMFSFRENEPEIFGNTIDSKLIKAMLREERKGFEMNKETMSFEDFTRLAKDKIREFLPKEFKEAKICIDEVDKLSGSYTGLSVRLPNQSGAPIVNLNQFYEAYQKGQVFDEALKQMADIVKNNPLLMDLSFLSDYEKIKDKLFIRVSNQSALEDKLSSIPHEIKEDLVITYHIRIYQDGKGLGSAMLTNDTLSNYGISKEQLQRDALLSTQKIAPLQMDSMQNILMLPRDMDMADNKMMVITNAEGMFGASAFFYPETMDKAAKDMGGNFLMLPSSVHEVILIPDKDMDLKEISAMVKEINQTQVDPEDRLSNHVYHYDAKEKIFERADHYEERMKAKEATRSVLHKLQNMKKQLDKAAPDHQGVKKQGQEL